MAINIQLKSFTTKAAPVPADIIYGGNSASSFDEVQMTIEDLIGAYPGLLSIGGLTTAANEYIYTTGVDTYAVHAITATPTASILAAWDANKNLSANNHIQAYTTTATAAGTTTLLVGSTFQQFFTGVTTQTVLLPVTSTLVLGMSYSIVNNSTGIVTVQSSGANTVLAVAPGTAALFTCILTSGTTAASWSVNTSGIALPVSIANGGTGVTSVTTVPAASAWAGWDANSNLSANNFLSGFTTTATAAGTTTLTVASTQIQQFTGATTQTVVMPVVSTLKAGQSFEIINSSTGTLTVNSSGGNLITTVLGGNTLIITCILITGTTAASWSATISTIFPPVNLSWTPAITFATPGDLSVSYSTQSGTYTRIGNLVYITFILAFAPTFTTASGSFQITGLPFAIGASCIGTLQYQATAFPAGTTYMYLRGTAAQSILTINASGSSTSTTALSVTQMTTGSNVTMLGTMTYLV